jgi:hypothetical protein
MSSSVDYSELFDLPALGSEDSEEEPLEPEAFDFSVREPAGDDDEEYGPEEMSIDVEWLVRTLGAGTESEDDELGPEPTD